jgi:uncharacterized RDD family membrane protein YckC
MPTAVSAPRDPTNVMGRRIAAFIIDLVIIVAVTIGVGAAVADHFTDAPPQACDILRDRQDDIAFCAQNDEDVYVLDDGQALPVWGAGILAALLNAVVLQSITGASVGKLITGLRVVGDDGRKAGSGRMFVRWLLLIVDAFFCYLVGLITALATHPHRRVGDMVAKTYVIGADDVGRPVVRQYTPSYDYATPAPAGGWSAPVAPPAAQPGWGTTPPPMEPAPWGGPTPQAAPPPPAPPPAPAPQAPPPAPAAPPAESKPAEPQVESWWDKALGNEGGDDES